MTGRFGEDDGGEVEDEFDDDDEDDEEKDEKVELTLKDIKEILVGVNNKILNKNRKK